MTLYIVPIEPLEERYTSEWYKYLPVEFANRGFTVKQIDGDSLTDSVECGTFLDMNSTVYYKSSQMQKIAKMFHSKQVKPGDIFFFSDLEFWGIEAVRLMSQINKVKIQIYGFLHAASYTKEDAFAVAADYQKYTELGWLKMADGVFVGSNYHHRAIMERRVIPFANEADIKSIENKIVVSGNPIFADAYDTNTPAKKKQKIVISNRFDIEKRPDQSLIVALLVKERYPATEIVITTGRKTFTSNQQWLVDMARMYESKGLIKIKAGLTKKQYHNELKSAKVVLSNSIEENFGYCVVEAIMFGAAPVVTRGLSHSEIVQNYGDFLFDTNDEAVEKTIKFLNRTEPLNAGHFLTSYFTAAHFMAEHMVNNQL